MSSVADDIPARFRRLQLGGGDNTTVSVGLTVIPTTLDAKCVAFRFQNNGTVAVRITTDGDDPTTSSGWNLAAGAETGWIDCVGSLVVKAISGSAAQSCEIWQVLDE